MSKAITEQAPAEPPAGWQHPPEVAPSEMRDNEPHLARLVGMGALACVFVGGSVLLLWKIGSVTRLSPTLAAVLCVAGIAGLLFHAASDPDLQVRRIYQVVGFAWLVLGLLATLLPINGPVGSMFLPWGYTFLLLGLLFLLPAARHETDVLWQQAVQVALGLGGVVMGLVGFISGNVSAAFFLPFGLLIGLLGLGYWWAFVGLRGTADDLGYKAGLAMGGLGLLAVVVALGRSLIPGLLHSLGWLTRAPGDNYLASTGVVLIVLGLLYAAVAAGLCSDNRLVVLTRRELGAAFFSPIIYFLAFGFAVVASVQFFFFLNLLARLSLRNGYPEPIILPYIYDFLPVLMVVLAVPLLTMRLLSEEQRSGTLEVLLTAPVDEASIVISKFLAALVFFLLIWMPFGIFLIGLHVGTGLPFDYRPLIGFFLALVSTGSGFLAMGLFFSSLSRNQIAAAVLTAMGMIVLLGLAFLRSQVQSPGWREVLSYTSFLTLWESALRGKLLVRDLLYHFSVGIFWLYVTTKVLESRKWR